MLQFCFILNVEQIQWMEGSIDNKNIRCLMGFQISYISKEGHIERYWESVKVS